MIQVPVAKGPSQQGGGPAIIGVLLVLVAAWLIFEGNRTHSLVTGAIGCILALVSLDLLTPKK